MIRPLAVVLVLAIVHCVPVRMPADEGPSEAVPELKALNKFVGSWETVITSDGTRILKGRVTAQWILDGRFLEQTASFTTPDGSTGTEVKRLMTYDEHEKTYRTWGFLSNGSVREEEGTWDPDTRTMTFVHRSDGTTITSEARFAEDGVVKLETVTRDGSGKEIARVNGTSTRREK